MTNFRTLAATVSAFLLLLVTDLSGQQSGWRLVPTGGGPVAREYGASFVYDQANDRLIMFGGNLSNTHSPTDEVWVLHPTFGSGTRAWQPLFPTGNKPSARANHGAVYDSANNRMIIFGGCFGTCWPYGNTVSILENANGLGGAPHWSHHSFPNGPAPSPRHRVAMEYDPDFNSLIVFGGDGSPSPADTWMLTNANGLGGPAQWVLVQAGGGPTGWYESSSAYDVANKRMIVSGGLSAIGGGGGPGEPDMRTNGVWVFNVTSPSSGFWENLIPENAPGAPPRFSNVHPAYDPATRRLFFPIQNPVTQTRDVWVLENESQWRQLAAPPFDPNLARLTGDASIYLASENRLISHFSTAWYNQLYEFVPDFNAPPPPPPPPLNRAPAFVAPTPVAPLSVIAGTPINFTVAASDDDANQSVQIIVNFHTLPPGVNVGPIQGANPAQVDFAWTPASSSVGTHTISMFAKDNLNAVETHTVTIHVLPVTLTAIAVTPSSASRHNGSQFFSATGTFSDGSTRQLPSGTATNQPGAPMWEVLFFPMINAAQCATAQHPANAIGSWSSQSVIDHNGSVAEVWSPGTPVVNVDGTINAATVSLTLACTNGSTNGSINATWTGTRYEGTYSLGGSHGNVVLTGWSTKASMPSPRFGFGAAAANGKVYAIGGVSDAAVLNRVESYDPATTTWTTGLAPMPTARSGHGVVAINDLIYAVGGSVAGDSPTGVLEVYHPATNTWSTGYAAMPTPRANLMAAEAGGKLYVFGGHDGPNNSNPLSTAEVYDPATNVWTPLNPLPSAEHFGAAGTLGSFIVVVGLEGTQKYDLAAGTWSAGVPIPGGRGAMAGGVSNGGFVVVGGQNGGGPVFDTLVYYPLSPAQQEGWAWLGSIPTARAELAAAVVGDVVYAIGGHTGGAPPIPGLATLDVLSVLPFGHLQTGFGGTSSVPTVQWSSSNPTVAAIDASGNAPAQSPGQTTIIASAAGVSCLTTNQCATFTVTNDPPVVQFNNSSFTMNESTSNSVFIGANAFDPDGDSVTREWSIISGPGVFTSGTSGFSARYQHHDGPATATIQLKVTDSYGAVTTATTTVTTNNVNPSQVMLNGPNSVQLGQTFTNSGSFNDPGADSWVVTVNYGDGTGDQTFAALPNRTFALSHVYASPGRFNLSARITDDDGGVSFTAFKQISVNEPVSPPTFSQTPNTPADACLCTPMAHLIDTASHNWIAMADGSGQLKVTLVHTVSNPSGQTVNVRVFDTSNGTQVGQMTSTYPAGSVMDTRLRVDTTVAASPGGRYRVEVASPQPSVALYWLRFDGAVVAGTGSPTFSNFEGGAATWVMNVNAGDPMGVRLFTQGVPTFNSGTRSVAYQWIAPNGQAEPVQTFNAVVPASPQFFDGVVPPPASPSAGIWRLRLSLEFNYRLSKTTGSDRGLYVDHLSSGRGSIRMNFVDQHGNPFAGAVNIHVSFGNSFTVPVDGGLLEVPDAEAFTYHLDIEPPPGFEASTPSLDLLVRCDQLTEFTVVIAPPAPPAISLTLSPNTIWPPNNKMVTVNAAIDASSPNGHATSVQLVSITSNESGAGDVSGAALGTDDRTFEVRAKRLGGGTGRIYTVTYRATDTVTGLSTTVTATVVVPHDQGK